MLTCKQTSELISQSLDKSHTWKTRFQIKIHLLMCKACQHYYRQIHAIKSSFTQLKASIENDHSITLSEDAKHKIIDQINKKQQ